jgi:two-component system cell cycle response regulator DivK
MVVEGDAHERAFHAMLLQQFDYRVAVAAAAEDALGMIALELPALIITELDLPEMSGLDLLARVQQDPRTAGIPVVALAANGAQETEARCRRAGFNACLGMPVGPEELFRTIQAAIEPVTRTSLRIHTKMPVIVNNVPLDCAGGECASVLSEQGMYIRTLKPYPPNARLAVQIGVRGRIIAADAVVLYNHQRGEGPLGEPGIGIKFSRIAPQDREFLRTFIHSVITS